jgi:hypothetical protein
MQAPDALRVEGPPPLGIGLLRPWIVLLLNIGLVASLMTMCQAVLLLVSSTRIARDARSTEIYHTID